jgi:enoyl-[acyl-carrier protein] reductase II
MVKAGISIPLIAAGGIGTGSGMLAAMTLGADGVQIGSRFIATPESSAHINFKNKVLAAQEGDTLLTLKELTPVRLLKNPFFDAVMNAYEKGSTPEKLSELLGRGRAKKGMFEGDIESGELEVGQISSLITTIKPAADVVAEIMTEFNQALQARSDEKYQF